MRFENIELEYFIDYTGKRIHLLDKTNSLNNNLFNVIGNDFKEKLIMKEHLLMDTIDFDWICYNPNGLIMAHREHNLHFVGKDKAWLHKPFTEQNKA